MFARAHSFINARAPKLVLYHMFARAPILLAIILARAPKPTKTLYLYKY